MNCFKRHLTAGLLAATMALPIGAMAGFEEDANTLFDWAEEVFPDLFAPSGSETLNWDTWTYRYYPATDTYVGVDQDGEVYVLGGPFANQLVHVDSMENLLTNFPVLGPGGCVNIPFPTEGSRVVWDVDGIVHGETVTGTIDTTHVTTTDTFALSSAHSELTTGGATAITDTDTEQTYHISDGFIYLEAIDIATTTNIGMGFLVTVNSHTSFTPAQLDSPAHDLCQGDTWVSDSVTSETMVDGIHTTTEVPTDTTESLVLSVGENLSTPAGDFSTVRVRTAGSDESRTLSWIDIDSGLSVRTEYYNPDGVLEVVYVATLVE